jgi:hypothetical protein
MTIKWTRLLEFQFGMEQAFSMRRGCILERSGEESVEEHADT